MSMDAKWYSGWVRLIPASTADEKMRNLEAADMLEELDKRVPRWISVEERLPEEDVDVLVFATGDLRAIIAITSYSHNLHGLRIDGWRPPWEYFLCNYKITHWMPLPEPPEEK